MKKTISLLLALVMCLSLGACGGTKLTVAKVEAALADCDGTLKMETSGNKVTGFTYTVESINAEDLVDRGYTREAIVTVLTGDPSKITLGQVRVSRAITPLMGIETLFTGDDDFDADAFVEKILDIACDGKTADYNGWSVSAEVDQENDCIVIAVASE